MPVALITAASQGVGKACAIEMASRGYSTALLARSQEIHQVAQSIGGIAIRGDLKSEADIKQIVEAAVKKFGRIDAMIINSGHPAKGDLPTITDDSWQEGFDLILRSVIRLCKEVVPVMSKQEQGGSIVAISSLWAVEPNLDAPVSSVFRAGLSAFVKLFSDRYAADKIRINCLLPGFMDTYPVKEHFMKQIPGGRIATAEEIARIAAFLVSSDAAYITGQSLRADGGLTRSF